MVLAAAHAGIFAVLAGVLLIWPLFESRTANAGVFFLTCVELSAAIVEVYSIALDDETNPVPGWVFLGLAAMNASACAAPQGLYMSRLKLEPSVPL